ncbi:MAG: T9SS type A sorting domain-containing protein, partial [Bacteroidales bacterium]|nr:T9SS type A sorting domain-containing protein [Bacteroidales bacterium]
TIKENAVANAGSDISICNTDGYVDLAGTVTNGNPVWQVTIPTGGFFEDENQASTRYFFSPDDVLLGTIELCLTAIPNNPCFIPDTDCLNLTITQSPDANAGIDKEVCEGESILMSDATVSNALSVEWTTNGDGTFNNIAMVNASYFPGEEDIANGSAQLCLKAFPFGGCSAFSINCMNLTILNAPSADLGPDRELDCADYDVDNGAWLPLQFNNTISGDYISIEWTTDGDGTFDNPNAVSPNYYLGLSDIWDGDLEICINIQAAGDCQFNVTQCVTIYVPQQLIYFDEDKWWGISSYLETDLPTVPEVMEPLVLIPGSQYLVNMVDKTGKYYWPEPVPPQATLGDWLPIGYKLKVKNTPACLPIYGDSLADQTFSLNGSFTYLPVLTNVATNIEDLFAGHLEDILLIYHWADNQLWTPIASDFDSIYPGYAYLLVNKFGYEPYTIEYPDFVPDAPHLYPVQVKKSEFINNSPWRDVENTALPHIFLFSDNAMNKLQPGDILGAFNQAEECFGMAEYGDKDAVYKLVAMGQNGFSKDERGFGVDDKMTFRIYRQNAGEELEVSFIFDTQFPSSNGLFANNGVSMVKDIVISATSINEPFAEDYQLSVYPNPASVELNVVSNQIISEIQLLNNLGQVVYQSNPNVNSTLVDISMHPKGIYLVAVKSENDQVTIKRVSIY